MKDSKNLVILVLFALFVYLMMKSRSSEYAGGCCASMA